MQKIVLINTAWSRYKDQDLTVDFIGYIDFEGSLFLKAKDIAFFFHNRKIKLVELQGFLSEFFLPKANGNFALIIQENSKCIIACDFSRNYPLYIINDNSKIIVTDHIGEISFDKENDLLALEQFLLSGLVTGNRTVFQNVKGLQAGEMAIITGINFHFYRYFILKSDPFQLNSNKTAQTIHEEMDSLFLTTFIRMIKSCPDINNWVVPLSGGHDSRLIISYLHRLGCRNVICFTYGIASSKEAEFSRLAAEVLGYKWYFIEYTPEDWNILHENKLFDRYINYSFNGCCLAHSQDLLALYKLKELGIIKNNDIIVPGHTAFTEAENIIAKDFSDDMQSFLYVYYKYYNLFECRNKFPRFKSDFLKLYNDGRQNKNSFPEFFNWQERQSKFINNSVRAYEFFGFQWRLPFWERDVINFWQKINFDDRVGRSILFTASKELLFNDTLKNIPILNKYDKPLAPKTFYLKLLPDRFIGLIVRILNRKPLVAEGTNYIFAHKASSVKKILSPMILYPGNLKKYFTSILSRRPYQVNVNAITAIYTLRNEVFSESNLKSNE